MEVLRIRAQNAGRQEREVPEKVMVFCRSFSALVMMLGGPDARDGSLRLKAFYVREEDKKELMRTKKIALV